MYIYIYIYKYVCVYILIYIYTFELLIYIYIYIIYIWQWKRDMCFATYHKCCIDMLYEICYIVSHLCVCHVLLCVSPLLRKLLWRIFWLLNWTPMRLATQHPQALVRMRWGIQVKFSEIWPHLRGWIPINLPAKMMISRYRYILVLQTWTNRRMLSSRLPCSVRLQGALFQISARRCERRLKREPVVVQHDRTQNNVSGVPFGTNFGGVERSLGEMRPWVLKVQWLICFFPESHRFSVQKNIKQEV